MTEERFKEISNRWEDMNNDGWDYEQMVGFAEDVIPELIEEARKYQNLCR